MVFEEILKFYLAIIYEINQLFILLEVIISINIDKCQ